MSLVGPKLHGLFASSPKPSFWGSIPRAGCSEGQILLVAWVGKGNEMSSGGWRRWILPGLGTLVPGQHEGMLLSHSSQVAKSVFSPPGFRWLC